MLVSGNGNPRGVTLVLLRRVTELWFPAAGGERRTRKFWSSRTAMGRVRTLVSLLTKASLYNLLEPTRPFDERTTPKQRRPPPIEHDA
ncbi:unnamed protein product [Linum tenue]|uniref:Uncharacterized protein n=1 Tax=Linum tenue TaxID=586396 RepID=A0AAV0KDJ7_9ROSI|nr:unnamed protein product [Linum tenue]